MPALGRPGLSRPDRFFLAVDHTVDPTTLLRDPRTQKLVQLSKTSRRKVASGTSTTRTRPSCTKFYRDLVLPGQVVIWG